MLQSDSVCGIHNYVHRGGIIRNVPLDIDLTTLSHYPSIAITKDDLQ